MARWLVDLRIWERQGNGENGGRCGGVGAEGSMEWDRKDVVI